MLVKENVERLKQDVELARQKSLLIDREADDTWVYGIGIDFRDIQEKVHTVCLSGVHPMETLEMM